MKTDTVLSQKAIRNGATVVRPKLPVKKNRGGRPKGSKNKNTLMTDAFKDGIKSDFFKQVKKNAPKIFEGLMEAAIEKEPWAVKLVMDKLMPNAADASDALKRGDLGINIVISDMKSVNIEEKVIEDIK